MKIKDYDVTERPREKLLKHGADKLSDAELLAIILNTGTKEKNVIELARDLLAENNNELSLLYQVLLNYLYEATSEQKSHILKGLGPAKIAKLISVFEIAKRLEVAKYPIVNTSFDNVDVVVKHYRAKLKNLPKEQFIVALVNRSNKIIEDREFGEGSLASVALSLREIFRYAIQKNAAGIFLIHNHPSNNCLPSEADKNITQRIKNVSTQLEIQLVDHLIITWDSYFSFMENNLLW